MVAATLKAGHAAFALLLEKLFDCNQLRKHLCTVYSSVSYFCGQQPGQVDLGDHLAAPVALPLVRVVVVLHEMPQFGAALQVRGDHGGSRAKAVGATCCPQHALCSQEKKKNKVFFQKVSVCEAQK